MSLKFILMLLAASTLFGAAFGYFLRWIIALGRRGSMELEIKQMELKAKEETQKLIEAAEKEAATKVQEGTKELKEQEQELKKTRERLVNKEELLDKRQADIDRDSDKLESRSEELQKKQENVEELTKQRSLELEKVAGLDKKEAKQELLDSIEQEYSEDVLAHIRKLEQFGQEKFDAKARDILTTAIHRMGNAMPTDVLATTVKLPSDEIKGKIIGKEGRNIRAFEQATGVDVIIDETPGTITISCFDAVRRQIARVALENLIIDGRIQPVKIEEAVEKAKDEIGRIIAKKGTEAAYEAGVKDLDPKLLAILGRMHFRTSYGQNVLTHSVEMAHIAGMIATEIGANADVARAGALLHDIGKAVDHEVAGTHVEIGRRILQKFGIDEEIIHAMEAHHEEYPYANPESYIVQVADSISGGRPGARRDTVENYIKRLEELEAITNEFPGVLKSYAIAAGREVRIFVNTKEVDDLEAHKMARDIAKRIEEDLKYPGEIKVNVIRETRAIEYAR